MPERISHALWQNGDYRSVTALFVFLAGFDNLSFL